MATPEEEIDRLDRRVTRLDENFFTEVKGINEKLSTMAVSNAERKDCPFPGLCVQLQAEIKKLWEKVDGHETRMQNVEKWQFAAMGFVMFLMTLLTLFGPSLRAMMHLP